MPNHRRRLPDAEGIDTSQATVSPSRAFDSVCPWTRSDGHGVGQRCPGQWVPRDSGLVFAHARSCRLSIPGEGCGACFGGVRPGRTHTMALVDVYARGFDEDGQPDPSTERCPHCGGRVTTTVIATRCERCGANLGDDRTETTEWSV